MFEDHSREHPHDHPDAEQKLRRIESAMDRIDAMQAHVDRIEQSVDRSDHLASLGTATAMVAHELNRLLTPIRAYADLALDRPENPELARKALTRARDNASQAGTIIDSVLTLAGEGSPGSDEDTAHVGRTVEAAVEEAGADDAGGKVRIRREIEPGLEAAASPSALHQVLTNLIANAIEAMQPRGGTLTIRGRRAEAPADQPDGCSTWNTGAGDRIAIEVEDTGCGIEAADLRRIFEPFVRGEQGSQATRRGSIGLGLAICKRLVEQAGGTIDVRSTPGRGTRFTLNLPAADAHAESGGGGPNAEAA